MAEVNEAAIAEKHVGKHNTGNCRVKPRKRAPVDVRPPSTGGSDTVGSAQPPPVRPLARADSRTGLVSQPLRQVAPSQGQPRPQFVPGGPVTGPQAFVSRPGAPPIRGPLPPGATQQPRPVPPPLRQFGPQSIAPQQGPRIQSPTFRAPPPNSLQFGPRQPTVGGSLTPDGSRPHIGPQTNGLYKNGAQTGSDQLPRQPSQGSLKGLDINYQNKSANLDNQSENKNENQNGSKAENGIEVPGMAKVRSYSIAAAPGAPSPLKAEDDRRKSVSALGGRIEEFTIRSPGLGLIQEGKTDSKDNVRESTENVGSEINESTKDIPDRPDSRLSASKMSESFIGTLPTVTPAKKVDDDDDVVLQNNQIDVKNVSDPSKTQDLSDRSPSLTRSDDSPEPKQITVTAKVPNKSQNGTPDSRPKTPKSEIKTEVQPEIKSDIMNKRAITPNKIISKSPTSDPKPTTPVGTKKPIELNVPITPESKKSTPRKAASAPKSRPKDGDNDSGVDESTQGNDMNGSPGSPNKKLPSKLPTKEKSSNSLKTLSRSSSKSAAAKTPENPPPAEKKKVPMNKIQVGNAPSPNLKAVKSKIGSLDNTTYKPGGGKVKIENRKLEFGNITPKIAAKNEAYTPSGGSKKIITTKLEWNAKPKVGSLQNAAYKPGGGDKKIETVKLDFTDKAKPKVGSTANITHKPGGGAIKIENQKLEFKAQSKVGSLENVKHKPGGGEIKIFEDKEYIKQMTGQSPVPTSRSHSRQESPLPPTTQDPKSDENLNQEQC